MRQEDDLPRLAAGGEPSLLRAHAGYADVAVHLRAATRQRDLPPGKNGLRGSEYSEFRASPIKLFLAPTEIYLTGNWNGITCKAPEAQIKFISNYFQ